MSATLKLKCAVTATVIPSPDPELRDTETVPLAEDVDVYMAREVLPHVPEAWVDEGQDEDRLRGYPLTDTSTSTSHRARSTR